MLYEKKAAESTLRAAYVRFLNLYPYTRYIPRWNDCGGTIVWFCCPKFRINDLAYEYGTYNLKSELLPAPI
jgi:hypothetical protein